MLDEGAARIGVDLLHEFTLHEAHLIVQHAVGAIEVQGILADAHRRELAREGLAHDGGPVPVE